MSKVLPRWRWELACKAAKLPDAQAQYVLQGADQATLDAYRFKRASDRSFFTEGPAHKAHVIYTERPHMRRSLECFMLAGEKDDLSIARDCDLDDEAHGVETVQAFHDIFFDVRARIHKVAWVAEQFFAGDTHRIASRHDNDLLYHRTAWFSASPALYRALIGRRSDEETEQEQARKFNGIIRSLMVRQAVLLGQCVGHGGELGLEVMRLVLEGSARALEQTSQNGGQLSAQLLLQVGKFMENSPLQVADPRGRSNLLQEGGREPRATLIPQETAP